jgi:hypothetical protein
MFQLQAPYPGIQTSTILPRPTFGDQENVVASLSVKRAMDGTRYTYVKQKGRRRFRWTFRLTRNKGLELRAFIKSYFPSKIKVTDHSGQAWVGNFISNPFEFETTARAAPAIAPMPRGETQVITIEFEGKKDGP